MKIMYDADDLKDIHDFKVCINGVWSASRPENYKKRYLNIWQRIKRSWLVFIGRADCFMWLEDK